MYVEYTSEQEPVKWWTFVQWTFSQPVYLPYISDAWEDKFLQDLIFDWCLSPYVEDTNIEYEERLCNISTSDYRSFNISIKEWIYWNDWVKVTNDDIYFTYNEIIKWNKWNIWYLESFSNINILNNETSIVVEFPNSSIDNKIFFTKFILPKHLVNWLNIQEYIQIYWINPIWTSCATIQQWISDPNSVVFDLSLCEDTFIRFYQAKMFSNFNEFRNYQQTSNIIDYYIWNDTIEWFSENKVILNNFVSIFFNVNSDNINWTIRRSLWNLIKENIYTWDYNKYFIKDNFLFETDINWNNIKEVLDWMQENIWNPQIVEVELENLPNIVLEKTWEYFLAEFSDIKPIEFQLDKSYESISVQANNWQAFPLQAYNWWNTARYNVSRRFNNIVEWKNNYKVIWYIWWNSEILFDIDIHYNTKPTKEIPWTNSKIILKVIYFENELNKFIANKLKKILEENWVIDYFEFKWYSSSEEFNWRILSRNYDITIRWIQMWLKKDISNIFTTSDPNINPSGYINNELASNINNYFRTEWNTKTSLLNSIHSTYSNEVPFIILWKVYWTINIKSNLWVMFPERLYDYWFQKDYLNDIIISFRPTIDWEELFNMWNFLKFIKEKISK